MAGVLVDITEAINSFLDYAFAAFALAALFFGAIKYTSGTLKKQGLIQGVYLSFVFILEIIFVFLFFWGMPILFTKLIPYNGTISFFRWLIISITVITHFYFRKHAEKRGVITAVYHLATLWLGWVINRWIGIFLFSLPLLGVFYFTTYYIALAIIPTSNPEDNQEKHQRFMIFLSYVWGLQMPLWNVSTADAKEAEKRIDGKPTSNPFSFLQSSSQNRRGSNKKGKNIPAAEVLFPGLIRTDTHQVVGIVNGKNFRVEGPGVIFTKKGDEPFEVVDLRTRTRKATIHAFSKEGIPFVANVSVTFMIDRDDWNLGLFHQLGKANTLLNKGKDIVRNPGLSFPYSPARVEAAIRLRSKSSQPNGEIERWDDYVLAKAEQAAREALAERSIKDLWQARENENSNASEAITANIKNLIENHLRENGIRLLSAKATGFIFSDQKDSAKKDEVIEQQIATWAVERDRELNIALADAKAEAERIEREARVYAESVLLTAIMEGLDQAREHHQGKDPDAIAQVYLDALKKMIEQQSVDNYYRSEALTELEKAREKYFSNSSNKK